MLICGCLAVAALSLLAPWSLAFDPWAWVGWGRDLARLSLDTSGGPSWKPLPVVATTPFTLAGDAAPALWLVVARASGLLALAGAATLTLRLTGSVAATVAATTALALSPWLFFNTALGNSEGMLAAAILWAAIAQLAGRERPAVAFGLAAALLRPEAWPFFGLYLLWLWRARSWTMAQVALALAPIPLLWFGPDLTGAGGALGASGAARSSASPESAVHAALPALAVLTDVVELITWPVLAFALVGIAATWRGGRADTVAGGRTDRGPSMGPAPEEGASEAAAAEGASEDPDRDAQRASEAGGLGSAADRRRMVMVLVAGAVGWVGLVAVMTQAGYAGNPRYNVVPAALACVFAGVGIAALPRARGLAAAALIAIALGLGGQGLRDQAAEIGDRAERRTTLDRLVGRARPPCAPLYTNQPMKAMVGWRLDLPLERLADPPRAPASILSAPEGYDDGPALPPAARPIDREGEWTLSSSCRVFEG